MTFPVAYFTWEPTTDQLRWDGNAASQLGLANDQLDSLTRWSAHWAQESRMDVARVIAESSRERPDPVRLVVHQQDKAGGVRPLQLCGDWVDGLICGVVFDIAQVEAEDIARSPVLAARQFTHDIAQPLAAASNYLAALEMVAGQSDADPALIQMAGAARNQVTRAGIFVRSLRERIVEADAR
ncbi:hypothetical protein NYR55_00565 [Sphingomonas sp. BGYR3]|uniref:hypothetical protein n=1 Tax=Sphingomonas sp. BGYR3 TaxID=2975483 RepID=UPI0021A8184B|nr:hypothetical protein [Sphingomonas sp. BGYR3]MDG5487122.1 hypothetical protein [Sphingomonas sp. BGYR3]